MNDQTERLPAFLRRRNGRLEMVQHVTWLQDWARCEERYDLLYNVMVEPTSTKVELNYGSAIHKAQSIRYRWEKEHGSSKVDFESIEPLQRTAIEEHFEGHPQPTDEYRNAGRAIENILAYNQEFPSHEWEVLAVEEEFEVEVGEVVNPLVNTRAAAAGWVDATIPCYLAGRKDLVVAWHGGIWINDFKTTKDWNNDLGENRNILMGRRSFQFRGYPWAEREKQQSRIAKLNSHRAHYAPNRIEAGDPFNNPRYNLPILGAHGIYMCSRPPYVRQPAPGKATARDIFHIECFPTEDSILTEWRSDFLLKCRRILAAWQSGEWERAYDVGCGGFGRCPFYDYCEEAPDRREAMLSSSMFQQKEFEREL